MAAMQAEKTRQVMLRLPERAYQEVRARAEADRRSMNQVANEAVTSYLYGDDAPEQKALLRWARQVFAPSQEAARTGYYITAWRRGKEIAVKGGATHLWSEENVAVGHPRPVQELPRLLAPTLQTDWPTFAAIYGADTPFEIEAFAAMWVKDGALLCTACSPGAPMEDGVMTMAAFYTPPLFWRAAAKENEATSDEAEG